MFSVGFYARLKTLDWYENMFCLFCFLTFMFWFCFQVLIIKDCSSQILLFCRSNKQNQHPPQMKNNLRFSTSNNKSCQQSKLAWYSLWCITHRGEVSSLQADYHTARTCMETTGCLQGGEVHKWIKDFWIRLKVILKLDYVTFERRKVSSYKWKDEFISNKTALRGK